jgi:divalent metal cation (Fe/Co/Zn/Cd) transporter
MHPNRRRSLLRRGLILEYLTLAWNVVGAPVLGVAAINASSVALAGFGFDSLIEIFASMLVIWHLREIEKSNEPLALRLIGVSFLCLAVYIACQTLYTLSTGGHPRPSLIGVGWLVATTLAMSILAWAKKSTGMQLANAVLIAESRVTFIDAMLAAAVLAGAVLNAAFGWWWADPLAGAVVFYYALTEGISHFREGSASAQA